MIVVVGNDARWNAEYQIQVREYGHDRAVGCELLPTRYDQVAVAFGAYGEQVTTPEALLPAARRAMNGNHFQMGVLAYNLSSYFRVARLTPGP